VMLDALEGKKALVTGASSGLGAHFAGVLAAQGVHVVLAARRKDALEAVATTIREKGGSVSIAIVDVTVEETRRDLFRMLTELDILVNNAGIVREAPALDHTEEDWDEVVNTNLKGMFLVAQSAAKAMLAKGGGSIINIASILGLKQAGGIISYAVSKAGVIQMTKVLALEWARYGIRVNALAPGYLETELNQQFWQSPAGESLMKRIPQRRLGRLADLDGPLLLLASDSSQYMTGSTIVVDGGHTVNGL
jgi:NAD(P)-dependent dehydrogenase (short-subunit alcohol dehydrogenase family)